MSAHSYISQFFSFNDTNIVAISYNILNLPDTIQFGNGNQIVNLYDATGRKYQSIVYTVPSTAITPVLGIVHYALDVDTIDYLVTEYAGSVENKFSRTVKTQRIHNTTGYYKNGTYYHYLKDHLGNICSVVNSNTDGVVQKIQYYASGVPMQSNTLGVQPYLYNSKELVTAHELNEYNYGFRNYYTTIGRFTSMDPLAEQTPWQSPYSYAGNRFVNAIDWMGLSGLIDFNSQSYGWVAIDREGKVVGWGNEDDYVYEVDDDWDETYEGLEGHSRKIGWELYDKNGKKPNYIVGEKTYFLGSITSVLYVNGENVVVGSTALMYGNQPVEGAVDNTISALWHYVFGFGKAVPLGNNYTKRALLANPIFKEYLDKIQNGEVDPIGHFSIDMTSQVFHIGNTNVYYYVTPSYIMFSMGMGDGFWDVLSLFEKNDNNPQGITPDGKGWKLEFYGIPYDYLPLVIILPNSK